MEGAHLGPYQILAELGSGGMGKVYRAEVTRAAGGLEEGAAVALKVIHAHLLEQEGFFKRFLREAQIGQAVEHENVVRCFDCDATMLDGASQHYLVMEYVEGQTLRDLLQELERVPEELCRHIGREIAKGLGAIHEAGVVHRDLKPENVLITPEHVVKVMDLGVARLQDEAIRLSQAGAFVGSLEYAAPEQFRTADGEPDGRADLHSLGVLLYELSTGQHPYRDEDASKVLRNILDEVPRKAGEVNPQLSPFFEEVVQTLIAKDRAERFDAAFDLAAILEDGEKSDWWKERAKALRIQTKRPLRRIRIPRETALYGRDDDLAKLHALYEKAKAGDGQVLLIEGEAGIGKTRLVDEFVGRLRQEGEDINFLFGSYPPGGAATAAGAFSEAYREQFGAEGLDDTLVEYLTPTPTLIPAFAAILKGETTPRGAAPLTKESLQTVFVHATRGLAAERTSIILIDDLHFAPEEGRALFTSVALAVPGHRVLLLGTMRPGVPEEWTAGITRLDQAEQRSLFRLGLKDFSALLKDAFRSERLAHELGMKIAEKSDGNPFFAFEIIRGLREGQFISQQPDGTWVTTRVIQDIRVPSSVLDLVHARVGDLSDEERNFLDVASCLGFEFDARVVADVLGLGRIPALQMLAGIEKRHRLARASGRLFVFDHHQVQEALYGGLSDLLREEYHAAIAEALQARAGAAGKEPSELDGALCVELCEHFLKGAKGKDALRYLAAALSHLEAGHLNDQVIALAERVLGEPGLCEGADRVALLLRMETRLDLQGRRGAQEAALAEALAVATATADESGEMKVELALGGVCLHTSRFEDAESHLERSLAIARDIGDRAGEALATGRLGVVLRKLDRYEEAQAHHERQLEIAREIRDRAGEARAIVSRGLVFEAIGRHEEARAAYERYIAVARETGDRSGEGYATGNLGTLFHALGRQELARTHIEKHLEIAREVGDRRGEAGGTVNLGLVFFALGRYGEARVQLERGLALCREIGHREFEAAATQNLGLVFNTLGRCEEARAQFERSLELAREIGNRGGESFGHFGLASVSHERGDAGEALALATQALAMRREINYAGGVAMSLVQIGEFHLEAGDVDEAREALDEAADLLRRQGHEGALTYALALLANLPGGDPDAVEAALGASSGAVHAAATYYYLWRVSGKREHLAEAKRLLDDSVGYAAEEDRASMLENVRLNREIMAAWAEHGAG